MQDKCIEIEEKKEERNLSTIKVCLDVCVVNCTNLKHKN